jgi:CRP/FNR family transcriptional regulator, cyclic AMP receptor protein
MKKILLIEDNLDIRENTAEILELANYKVFTAENGKIGVEIAIREKPDLIICDITMPVLDGYGVLHLVQKNQEIKNTPFIFLSAKTERLDIRRGMDSGADDYLTKPFDGTELLAAVETRLRKTGQLIEDINSAAASGLTTEGNGMMTTLELFIQDRNINRYKKKQTIYMEGNRPSQMYYIQKGKIKTFKSNDNGKELVVGLHNEGDFLGYIPLLESGNYKESAEAIEDSELAVIPKEDFEKIMNNNREVARKFITLLAKNVTEKEEQLLRMAYSSLRKKVADTLLALHKKYKSDIDISRENLASIAGTATESVIRTLGDFKEEKLIDLRGSSITILNEKKLEALIN